MREGFRRGDILLVTLVVAAALILWVLPRLASGRGAQVVVSVDGTELMRLPLTGETAIERDIDTGYGQNTLIIHDGVCQVTEADCPDRLCVRQGSISRRGESIVCLPHRLIVTIEGDAGEAPVESISE